MLLIISKEYRMEIDRVESKMKIVKQATPSFKCKKQTSEYKDEVGVA
ncbi:MAG: hypothetical protein Sapg2KO_49860 [Saprospiraceae bacterium]